jgi:integrase/recombinase XerD
MEFRAKQYCLALLVCKWLANLLTNKSQMKHKLLEGFTTSHEVKTQLKVKDVATSVKGMLRSRKGDKKGIYIRVTINREQEYFPTNYYVYPKDFDSGIGLVKTKTQDAEKTNSYIRYLSNELDTILTTLKKSGEVVCIKNFRKHYETKIKQDQSFSEFFARVLKEKQYNIQPSTFEIYSRLPKKILEFRPNVTLRDIDRKFVKEWEQWLLHTKKICQNTTNHYLEKLRTFLLIALDEKLIDEYPFAKIKIPKILGDRDYLTEEELQALIEVSIPETHQGEIRAKEMFVFCCLTGIRYSDLVNLKWEHIRPMTNDMHFHMHKTKLKVSIPLIEKAKAILERQDKKSEYVFKRITNQKFNEHLHSIEKRAKIQKNITVHVARHTFATLALERGIPLEVVAKILGHVNIKTTMIYARITQKRLQGEMQKMNGLAENLQQNAHVTSVNDINVMVVKMQDMIQRMQILDDNFRQRTGGS